MNLTYFGLKPLRSRSILQNLQTKNKKEKKGKPTIQCLSIFLCDTILHNQKSYLSTLLLDITEFFVKRDIGRSHFIPFYSRYTKS